MLGISTRVGRSGPRGALRAQAARKVRILPPGPPVALRADAPRSGTQGNGKRKAPSGPPAPQEKKAQIGNTIRSAMRVVDARDQTANTATVLSAAANVKAQRALATGSER